MTRSRRLRWPLAAASVGEPASGGGGLTAVGDAVGSGYACGYGGLLAGPVAAGASVGWAAWLCIASAVDEGNQWQTPTASSASDKQGLSHLGFIIPALLAAERVKPQVGP
jgi:hypothetical protein